MRKMCKIKAYDDRATRQSTRIVAIILGIVFVVFGAVLRIRYAIPVGAIIVIATIMQKNTFITTEGIDIEYDYIVHKHVMKWDFDEITDIHIEQVKDKRFIVLYFLRGVMTRRLVFYKEDVDEVLLQAKNKNPNIHIEDVDS
ncbi:MAG: hypothetical protein RR313_03055 [Anaerovoracaceae bacterium]